MLICKLLSYEWHSWAEIQQFTVTQKNIVTISTPRPVVKRAEHTYVPCMTMLPCRSTNDHRNCLRVSVYSISYLLLHLFWASLSACRLTFESRRRCNNHVCVIVYTQHRALRWHCAVTPLTCVKLWQLPFSSESFRAVVTEQELLISQLKLFSMEVNTLTGIHYIGCSQQFYCTRLHTAMPQTVSI